MTEALSRPIAGSRLTPRAAAAIVAAVGATAAIGGLATAPAVESRWYRRLRKPDWQPPGAVFGPVWSVLYALIAASMLDVRRRRGGADQGLWILYGSNLALNLAWTLIFFRGRSPLAASAEIVALEATTLALIVRVRPISPLASLALIPYALWVAVATALTWAIATRNA